MIEDSTSIGSQASNSPSPRSCAVSLLPISLNAAYIDIAKAITNNASDKKTSMTPFLRPIRKILASSSRILGRLSVLSLAAVSCKLSLKSAIRSNFSAASMLGSRSLIASGHHEVSACGMKGHPLNTHIDS